jgi:hypothetical protein
MPLNRGQKQMDNRSFAVANDDLLWILDGVEWEDAPGPSPKVRGIATLIESPKKFVAENQILVYKTKPDGTRIGPGLKPKVKSPFVILFKDASGTDAGPVCVQGIHNTSVLTVRPKGGIVGILTTGIPGSSPIRVTLVGDPIRTDTNKRNRAYIHWEINPKSPTDHTTPTDLKNHVMSSLRLPERILKDYYQRLNSKPVVGRPEDKVFFVDEFGLAAKDMRAGMDIEVQYGQPALGITRELICQGIDSEKQWTAAKPVISCNVDIGNYYVENGVIHIVVDTTIVKFY